MRRIVFLFFLNLPMAFAQTATSDCGSLGCGPVAPSSSEILAQSLLAQQTQQQIALDKVSSVELFSEMPLVYIIKTQNSAFEMRIEFLAFPMSVDGIKPIKIGNAYAIVTVSKLNDGNF